MDAPLPAPAGTQDALLDVLIRDRARLVGIAARILSSRDLAEDVVQEVMLKACERDLTCLNCPFSFACRMVRNLAVDRARRRQLEGRIMVPEEGAEEIGAPVAGAEQAIAGCEALATVSAALATLPQRTRRAFLRHRLDGVAQKDIARELGVSPTLVNFMIRDAEKLCRARLAASEALIPQPACVGLAACLRHAAPAAPKVASLLM